MTRTNASHRSSALTATALVAGVRPLGRAALSCGLAGALTLGAAVAASAGERPAAPDAAAASGRTSGQGQQQGKQVAGRGAAPDAAAPRSASKGGAPAARPEKARSAAPDHRAGGKGKAAPATAKRGHDPAGNNGTIKVDGPAWDARVDNEPHTSCAFRVTFFGFDEGQTADITVTGVAPTGGGVLLHETAVPTSDDAAGGAAQDFDGATRVLTADDLGLDAVTPHPKQGYHLKVTVDSLEAPGGAKTKVFWLQPCEDQSAVTPPAPGVPGGDSQIPSTPVPGDHPVVPAPEVPSPEVQTPGSEDAVTSAHPSSTGPLAPSEAAFREGGAAEAGTTTTDLASSVAATTPTSQASALPARLAFTGAEGLALLALAGVGAAGAGLGLQAARRRLGGQAG